MKVGDVCIYHFGGENHSVVVVEIVQLLNDKVSKVAIKQVIADDSGNGLFEYLCKTGKTMNASHMYLHPLYCNDRIRSA